MDWSLMFERLQAFNEAMQAEREIAREYNGPFHSLHEGYAVLLKEVLELQAQTFKQFHNRSRQEIIKECVQIATMAFCIVDECIGDVTTTEIDCYRISNVPPADEVKK